MGSGTTRIWLALRNITADWSKAAHPWGSLPVTGAAQPAATAASIRTASSPGAFVRFVAFVVAAPKPSCASRPSGSIPRYRMYISIRGKANLPLAESMMFTRQV